ncbi:MAG: DUF370 domain-containing protein [Peptococcaceae bacterium]|nr:DUF370 domain-containing protein [Peptococcaceae bacterium]
MYLHIGNNQMIRENDIIAIVDLNSAQVTQETRQALDDLVRKRKKDIIEGQNKDKAKSLIITNDSLFYSSISSVTLMERSKEMLKRLCN